MRYCLAHDESNLDTDLLIDTLLLLLDLLFELLDRCSVRRGTVGLKNLDIPSSGLADRRIDIVEKAVHTRLLEV
jgi:hypothetical protein